MIYCLVRTRGPNWRLVDADGSKAGSCSRSRLRWRRWASCWCESCWTLETDWDNVAGSCSDEVDAAYSGKNRVNHWKVEDRRKLTVGSGARCRRGEKGSLEGPAMIYLRVSRC
jgi:hypothetical protein